MPHYSVAETNKFILTVADQRAGNSTFNSTLTVVREQAMVRTHKIPNQETDCPGDNRSSPNARQEVGQGAYLKA